MPLFELSFIYRDFCGATAQKAFNIKLFLANTKPPKTTFKNR